MKTRYAFVAIALCSSMSVVAFLNLIVGEQPSALARLTSGQEPPSIVENSSILDGLVVYYSFDGGNADDESGNGNHGAVSGAVPAPNRFNQATSAYEFDGVDDYIVSSFSVPLTTTYSVSLWFKHTHQSGTWARLFHRGYAGLCEFEPVINIVGTEPEVRASVSGCNGTGAIGSYPIALNVWYHVAVVVQENVQKLYINDSEIASSQRSPDSIDYKLFLGVSANGDIPVGQYFGGIIDEVRVYNRALTGEEIRVLYGPHAYLPLVMSP